MYGIFCQTWKFIYQQEVCFGLIFVQSNKFVNINLISSIVLVDIKSKLFNRDNLKIFGCLQKI